MNRQTSMPDVQVSVRGPVPPAGVRYADERIRGVVRLARQSVLNIRIRLVDSSTVYPRVLAQANLDLNGRPLRAQVAGSTVTEAVDLLAGRLWRQLTKARGRGAHRDTVPIDRWREPPARHPVPHVRPVTERRIVRRKSFTLPRCTVDEAAFEMNLMDYDFHLFTGIETGQDGVLYRAADGTGYRLTQVDPQPGGLGPTSLSLTVDEQPAPRLTVPEALRRLELSGQPFVFFVDEDGGRGRLLYTRHDRHYGLISPVEAEPVTRRPPISAGC